MLGSAGPRQDLCAQPGSEGRLLWHSALCLGESDDLSFSLCLTVILCERWVWVSHFCRQWRLKPSASKTISSVFHLHNTSATRELSVYLDGLRLRHECHPTYLGVTLDRTLFYREHLTKTAGKLKNRNNLLMKLAGSTWGASANTLRSSALALCYLAAEHVYTIQAIQHVYTM